MNIRPHQDEPTRGAINPHGFMQLNNFTDFWNNHFSDFDPHDFFTGRTVLFSNHNKYLRVQIELLEGELDSLYEILLVYGPKSNGQTIDFKIYQAMITIYFDATHQRFTLGSTFGFKGIAKPSHYVLDNLVNDGYLTLSRQN